ncbi:ATP-dependent DNA helicase RecQ [Platysternon megacephalum]|uniref:ATP-dependent DNA helicase RecQ n=1 Tax=Platysternon megacephalum TaxID=55544 RepID=A0A4D9DC88_9SAUR|nr:ATP-dependent DNA helicase RecQ [Platysternon megacephalum]
MVSPTIVGGEKLTTDAQNPGAVHLVADWTPMACTGSLIGKRWVLTARHCVDEEGGYAQTPKGVVAGTIAMGGAKLIATRRVFLAPDGDTALIQLASDAAGKVLPYASNRVPLNKEVLEYGWGWTSPTEGVSPVLKMARAKTIRYADNFEFERGKDVVAKGITGSTWSGDSGGPLIYQGVLVGNTSGGLQDGKTITAETQFAMTSQNAAWIRKTTGIAGVIVS